MAFLFLVSIRYVMYSVAVAREMKIMLYSACESSAELAGAIKRFNWKFGLFVFIPHARDWFDLFVRFTPHFLNISWICGLDCGQLWTALDDCLYKRTLRSNSRSFVA